MLGGGIGLRLTKSSRAALDVFSGTSLNQEFYSGEPGRRSGEALVGQELTCHFNRRITTTERLSVFPNLSDTGQYRLTLDSSATLKLNTWLGWQATLSNIYVSNPPPGAANNDVLLSTGLRFSLGKTRSFNPGLQLLRRFWPRELTYAFVQRSPKPTLVGRQIRLQSPSGILAAQLDSYTDEPSAYLNFEYLRSLKNVEDDRTLSISVRAPRGPSVSTSTWPWG